MKQRVYIETSIVSYLTARPSRDLVLAAHQQVTHEWWQRQRRTFELCTSQIALDEAGKGDPLAAVDRMAPLSELPLLPLTDEVRKLTAALLHASVLPENARVDAVHVAVATVHDVDVILTWNCRHLANASILVGLGQTLRALGYEAPIICTPDELMGE
jgi:hypothetical protein